MGENHNFSIENRNSIYEMVLIWNRWNIWGEKWTSKNKWTVKHRKNGGYGSILDWKTDTSSNKDWQVHMDRKISNPRPKFMNKFDLHNCLTNKKIPLWFLDPVYFLHFIKTTKLNKCLLWISINVLRPFKCAVCAYLVGWLDFHCTSKVI